MINYRGFNSYLFTILVSIGPLLSILHLDLGRPGHRGSQRHLSTENSVLKIHVTLYARCDLSKWESRKTNFRA